MILGRSPNLILGAFMARPAIRTLFLAAALSLLTPGLEVTGGANHAADRKNVIALIEDLLAYSPLHNIREGVKYPATLITTADHDDRVVPAHSFKYAATLQEKASGDNPVLIRIETKSGHGSSNTTKAIEQTADIYAFVMYNLGVTPKYDGLAAR